jgi:hypothetical protein
MAPNAKPTEAKDVPLTNPLGIQSIYANDFGLGFTFTDIRLIFNELGADVVGGVPSKILKANIVVPLAGAEALAKHILASLEQHNKNLQVMQNAKPAANA